MQPVKNKKMTYLLLCAVAGVWGVIIYRLFFLDIGNDEHTFLQAKVVREPYDQYVAKNDTFKLVLNYRDPFLAKGHVVADTPKVNPAGHKEVMMVNKPAPPPPINWGIIRYSGYIINPQTKSIVSILSVNEEERMVAEGEVFRGVKLIKNKKDSILVSWLGKQKYIKQ